MDPPGPPPQPIRIVDLGEENIQIYWDKIEPVFCAQNLGNRPICLVTAVGVKWAFVLNYINRFLKHGGAAGTKWMADGDPDAPLSGFNEFGPFSPGIDLWPTGYTIVNNHSTEIAVFLLHITTGREMSTTSVGLLYEFGLSICDIVVFASEFEIHEQDFKFFCNAYEKLQPWKRSIPFISQVAFMVFQPTGQTKYGAPPGEVMLEKFLKTTWKKKLIKDMMTQFGEIACTLLPAACRDNISPSDFNGSFNQLNQVFVKHLRQFITSILEETLSAKRVGGADVTCERAVDFFRFCAAQLCSSLKIGAQVLPKPAVPPVLIQGSPIIKTRVTDTEVRETSDKEDKQNGELKVAKKESECTVPQEEVQISATESTDTKVASVVVHSPQSTPNAHGTNVSHSMVQSHGTSKAPVVSENKPHIDQPSYPKIKEEAVEPWRDAEEVAKLSNLLFLQLQRELAAKESEMSEQEQELQIEKIIENWSTQLKAKNVKITEGSELIFRRRLKYEQQKVDKHQAKRKRDEHQKERWRELELDVAARIKNSLAAHTSRILSLQQFDKLEDKKEEIFQQIVSSRNPLGQTTDKAEFAKFCGNAFDSVVNESKANFQKLCGLHLEKRAEYYQKSVLAIFAEQNINKNSIEQVSHGLRASAQLFPDIRQKQLLAEFPAFTKIKLYHELDKFDEKLHKLLQEMKNVESKIETKFREQICFSAQDFKIQITPLLTNLASANTFVDLETFVNCSIQKYHQQNENALKVEMETIGEAKNEIVNFYQEEMKAYIVKNSSCFKNDLEKFHAGLVNSLIDALQESLGYTGQSPEFFYREMEILETNLTTYLEKYRDMNARNLEICLMKLANFFTTRRSDYNSKMADFIALKGPFEEKRLNHEHRRIRDEVKKLFQLEIKNLVENLEPELNQLQAELDKEFAKHQKTNGEQLERKREENERQRVIDEDIRKKNEEAAKAMREEQRRMEEAQRAAARAQKQRDEESRRTTRSQNKQTTTTQFTYVATSHESASARTPPPAPEVKWVPSTVQQTYAVAAGGKPVCIAIEFGLHYLRIGFMKANGEVQLIPGETGLDIFNTLTVRNRNLYVGANENSSDMPINVGELLCGVSPATETTLILKGGVHDLRVEEIFGIVLHEAKLRATKYLQKQVQEACIVVPVWLTLETKKAIEIGARISGFERTKLISEFAAAAMNFNSGPCAVEYRLFITTSRGHFHAALFQFSSREVKMIRCGSTLHVKTSGQTFTKLFHALTLGVFSTDEKAKILQDVVGSHTTVAQAYIIVTDIDNFGEIKSMIEKEFRYCKVGNLYYHGVIKGAARWASKSDGDETKAKDLAFYKIVSQHGRNDRVVCKANDPPNAHIEPHDVIVAPFQFLVHEVVQGKERCVGEFIVTPTTSEEAHGRCTFLYKTSGEGTLTATAKFGSHTYQAEWNGSTLNEEGIANSVSKLNNLFS